MLLFAVALLPSGRLSARSLHSPSPRIEGFHPLEERPPATNPLADSLPAILDLNTSLFKDTAYIDFEKRQISFARYDREFGIPVWQYHYPELEEYLLGRRRFALTRGWKETTSTTETVQEEKRSTPSLDFRLPVHYPDWARRVLGNEPPTLSIHGYQEIAVTFETRNKQRDDFDDLDDYKPGLKFDQNNDFSIRGSIGRLISIEIKAGSSQDEGFGQQISDQLKNFKIEYKGEGDELEDEIIQEVSAGYTNFPMPGAGLAGYAGSHEGLFGIKVRSRFGPLELTSILSHEKSQTQKKEIDLTSGSSGTIPAITEKEYAKNRFFFLDSVYLEHYLDESVPAPRVTELQVYKLDKGYETERDPLRDYIRAGYGDVDNPELLFYKLREDEDYFLDREKGFIVMADAAGISSQDVIGIYMETTDPAYDKGDLSFVPEAADSLRENLWVLKGEQTLEEPTDSTYHLMWRNVYFMPQNAVPDAFTLTVERVLADSNRTEYPEGKDANRFTTILGLAAENGEIYKDIRSIFHFNRENGGEYDRGYVIIPPWNSDSLGHWPFANPALGKNGTPNYTTKLYRLVGADWNELPANFEITMTGGTSASRQTSFNIGWGVLDGSERVTMNGGLTTLERNEDYTINYATGTIELLSNRAKSATDLDVEYQQESMLGFDQKGFIGLHGKLDLPSIGRDSYLGTSLMYQSASVHDDVPRLGQEPFKRFMFAANSHINFEPEWMTKAINALPLVKTTAVSSATFDIEMAGSLMNPSSTAEKSLKGQAYIDNFESSADIYSLGELHASWYKASPPFHPDSMELDTTIWYRRPPAWDHYWFTPVGDDRTRIDDIYQRDLQRNTEYDLYAPTLRMVVRPVPDNSLADGVTEADGTTKAVEPWAGIMQSIPLGLKDRENSQYFEFWVRQPRGGVLTIDFGEVSEDLVLDGTKPNERHDTERPRRDYLRDNVEPALDLGLDSLDNEDELYHYPQLKDLGWEWKPLAYGDSLLGRFKNDPGRDDWKEYDYDKGKLENRSYVNGTQGNRGYLDEEDINRDEFNIARHNYFRTSIDFNNFSRSGEEYYDPLAQPAGSEWHHFRIKLHNNDRFDSIGTPDWRNVRFVRLSWSEFPEETKTELDTIEFTGMRFVGNQWEGIDTSDTSKITSSVVNTEDNYVGVRVGDEVETDSTRSYIPPRRIRESLERQNPGAPAREQALRLSFDDLEPGDVATVERHLTWQEVNLSAYDQIRMFLRAFVPEGETGSRSLKGARPIDENIWFVFRFGTDDSTYYEYRKRRLAENNDARHWEELVLDLRRFADLKLAYLNDHDNIVDSIDTTYSVDSDTRYRVVSHNPVPPTFTTVRWMALGVAVDSTDPTPLPDSGEILIEGIRASGLDGRGGWAFTGRLSTRWADFMNLSGNINYRNADFRQMSQKYLSSDGSSLSGAVNVSWSLHKFLPDKWGVSLPVGADISTSLSRPKLRPGTDVYLTDEKTGKADNLSNMARDFAGMAMGSLGENVKDTDTTDAEKYETQNATRTVHASYGKSVMSDNPITNLTVDRLSASVSYTVDTSMTAEGTSRDGGIHARVRAERRRHGNLKYDLSPRTPPRWTTWEPFRGLQTKWVPRRLKDYRLSLLPHTATFDVADVNYNTVYDSVSREDGRANTSNSFGLRHGMQLTFAPIDPLIEADFSLGVDRNLGQVAHKVDGNGSDFFKNYIMERDSEWKDYYVAFGEDNRNQRLRLDFSPEIFNWLTHTFTYKATSSQRKSRRSGDSTSYLDVDVTTSFDFNTDLRIRSLLSTLGELAGSEESNDVGALEHLERAFSAIEFHSLRLTYRAESGLRNNYLDTAYVRDELGGYGDLLSYQLGFRGRSAWDIITGDYDDRRAFGGVLSRKDYKPSLGLYENDSRTGSQDISVSTNLKIPGFLDMRLSNIKAGWRRTYSWGHDGFKDTSITFPDVSMGANSSFLQKLPFVKLHMRNLDLSTSWRYERTRKIRPGAADSIVHVDTTTSFEFAPIVGLRGTVKKWPINVSYRANHRIDETGSANGTHQTTTNFSQSLDVDYTIRPDKMPKELNLFNRWIMPINGELRTGLRAEHSTEKTQVKGREPTTDRTIFSIHPNAAYDFTDNVEGRAEYRFGSERDNVSKDTYTDNAFTMTVRITF